MTSEMQNTATGIAIENDDFLWNKGALLSFLGEPAKLLRATDLNLVSADFR